MAERTVRLLSPLLLLGTWQLGALVGVVDTRFFPAPSTILEALFTMIRNGQLWAHLSASLQRIVIGFLIGAIPGIVIGLAMGLMPLVRAFIQPIVDATFPIPKIAVLPLFILIFGLGEESKYAIIAVAVIFLMIINTVAGVRNIERIYLDVGRSYHASRLMMFTDVAWPGALPTIWAGIRIATGVSLLVIVGAEFVAANTGIGFLIWTSWQVFQVDQMYVGLMVIAALGLLISYALEFLERLIIPWKAR